MNILKTFSRPQQLLSSWQAKASYVVKHNFNYSLTKLNVSSKLHKINTQNKLYIHCDTLKYGLVLAMERKHENSLQKFLEKLLSPFFQWLILPWVNNIFHLLHPELCIWLSFRTTGIAYKQHLILPMTLIHCS